MDPCGWGMPGCCLGEGRGGGSLLWASVLVQATGQVRVGWPFQADLRCLPALDSVLDTCTLWDVPFPWSQRNREAAGKLFP